MAEPSSRSGTRRVVFVDLLRLLATFQMVQGHSIDAVLSSDLRTGAAFDAWTWTRGLTSVAFLFAAGLSFHLSTLTRLEAHRSNPAAVRRRVRRGLLLVFIGYLLHNPFGAFSTGAWGAALAEAAIVDVLQCIGVSILILEAIAMRARTARQVTVAATALAILCVGLWPLAERVTPGGPLAVATNYLTHAGGSIFPLFPWAGYLFLGVLAGALVRPGGSSAGTVSRPAEIARLLGLGAALLVASYALRFVPYGEGAVDPAPGVFKLGVVVLLCGVLSLVSVRLPALPRRLGILGGETLVIYVVHIVALYGAGYGLADVIGPTLELAPSVALAIGMVVASALVGLAWHAIKTSDRRPRPLARGAKAG